MQVLTSRQKEALLALVKFHKANGYYPSQRQLLPILGLTPSSTNAVFRLLAALQAKGYIVRGGSQNRIIKVKGK